MNLELLYGKNYDREKALNRISEIKKQFYTCENEQPTAVFSSSGRAEILGNHTDHNHGKVIVAAIGCDILAAVKKRDDGKIKICSEGFSEIFIDISDIEINKEEYGTSTALTRGVIAGIKQKGYNFNGFTAYITSTIFKGAGVSSSAAFELLICEIINTLYLGGALNPVEKAVISQMSENLFFGKPCGLLDQMGISLGGFNMLDFNNPSMPVIEKTQAPEGYTLVITNTGGDHANLTEHYAAIKTEMHQIAEFFGRKFLRDVPFIDFFDNIHTLKNNFSERAILRAFHFYNENERVEKAALSLKNKATAEFLKIVTSSGDSSLNCLQNCYVPGETVQPIPLAIQITKQCVKDGGVRVHGGGFAGTVLAFVKAEEVSGYVTIMSNIFGKENVFETAVREVGACQVE